MIAPSFRSPAKKRKPMKFSYATFADNGVNWICFSRKDISIMRNSIDEDNRTEVLMMFLDEMESKITS